MDYFYRIKCRIKEEGITSTIKYVFLVSFYCITTLVRYNLLDFKYSGRSLHKSVTIIPATLMPPFSTAMVNGFNAIFSDTFKGFKCYIRSLVRCRCR